MQSLIFLLSYSRSRARFSLAARGSEERGMTARGLINNVICVPCSRLMFFQLTRDCAWSIALQPHVHLSGHVSDWSFHLMGSKTVYKCHWRIEYTRPWGKGLLLGILGDGVQPVLQMLTCFRPKTVIFQTRFQTRPLKLIPFFRPGGGNKTQHYMFRHKKEIMSSLLRLKPQPKDFFKSISNSHITLSFLFSCNWND